MRATGFWLLTAIAWLQASVGLAVDYERDVKPILATHCYSCHGGLRQKSELRVDHVSFLRKGGALGSVIADKSDDSLLIQAVTGSGEIERMPLEAKPLAEEQIATLRAWIDAGAPAPDEPLPPDPRDHWSFKKPVRPELPQVQNADWASHPLDRFLAAEHEARGLVPTKTAEKHVLLRRVYLDLIGLPPTPEELRAFLADESSDAYEKVVDRLLASPHYGERWGRHWMDVWRYSDWDGYAAEVRESQPHIWRWRDWIIESLNADKPYDEMVAQMLAADELAPGDENALRATGFLVRNWYKFNRNVWLENTVEHTSKAFLGITLNCARCHDHMYDPIAQTEYYQFRAFFEPHDVRTDRVPGESDTTKNGLVRVFDGKPDAPTYLFTRGNEAQPDKEHPLVPAAPQALGGDTLAIAPVTFRAAEHYPGLRSFVQQEELAKAQTALTKSETSMAQASESLAAARKNLEALAAAPAAEATTPAATNAGNGAPAEKPAEGTDKAAAPAAPDATQLTTAVRTAERAASLAEQELFIASADLTAVRAKIVADNAAFATPPSDQAGELAREAARAERVANAHRARLSVMKLENELADASTGTDDAAKKKAAEIEKKLTEARKAHETAQAALGKSDETYTRFGAVYANTSTGRRAALARWIASKNNPLTARVAVNQIWMRHLGAPLVASVFDFGLNGKAPSHPALLDWLAVELMDQDWRMKPIHRLIVTSTAYRMASTADVAANHKLDAENVYLWRANPRRMEAEVVRDSTLAVAGSLDVTQFGPELAQNTGMTVPRRSIYFRSSKEKKMTFLDLFDRANVTDCYRRSETVVPQQALAMINSPLSLAQARKLTALLIASPNANADSKVFVAAAFERILCRTPTEAEQTKCLEFLEAQAQRFADPTKLAAFTSGEDAEVKPSADPNIRARENLVHVLLNHNDFLTVR
jgi:hypothetical protein